MYRLQSTVIHTVSSDPNETFCVAGVTVPRLADKEIE